MAKTFSTASLFPIRKPRVRGTRHIVEKVNTLTVLILAWRTGVWQIPHPGGKAVLQNFVRRRSRHPDIPGRLCTKVRTKQSPLVFEIRLERKSV